MTTRNMSGKVQTSIFLDPVLWKKVKIQALNDGIFAQTIVEEGLDLWFKHREKKK
jgi:hypothetical protein